MLHINNVFNGNIPFKFETVYLGNLGFETWNINDKKIVSDTNASQ